METLGVIVAPKEKYLYVFLIMGVGGAIYGWLPAITRGEPHSPILIGISTYIALWCGDLLVLLKHFKKNDGNQIHGIIEWYTSIFLVLGFLFLILSPFFGLYVYFFHIT